MARRNRKESYIQRPWRRNPMTSLYRNYFYFHFTNWPTPPYRNGCYLCYQVERTQNRLPVLINKGVFENKFYPEEPRHAELCFLDWFKTQEVFVVKNMPRDEKYHVKWFMSWSPCFECARKVVEYLKDHKHVQLSIFTARLYFSRKPEYQQGLLSLDSAGASVAVMSADDFFYCWKTFVDHQQLVFQPWKKIHKNSRYLSKQLENILKISSLFTFPPVSLSAPYNSTFSIYNQKN